MPNATVQMSGIGTSSPFGMTRFRLAIHTGTISTPDLARTTTATIRRRLITVPARMATSARRITLHLPAAWPWETAWTALFDRVSDPPSAVAA